MAGFRCSRLEQVAYSIASNRTTQIIQTIRTADAQLALDLVALLYGRFVVRLQFEHLVEVPQRLLIVLQVLLDQTQSVVGFGVVRIQIDCGLQALFRLRISVGDGGGND